MTELGSCGMRPKGPDRGCVRTSASAKPWSRTATARWATWFKTETSDEPRRKPPKPLTRVQIPAAAPNSGFKTMHKIVPVAISNHALQRIAF
jgi:hypothetical protein